MSQEKFPYTILSLSSDVDVTINSLYGALNGQVASNFSICAGNLYRNGKFFEKVGINRPILKEAISKKYFGGRDSSLELMPKVDAMNCSLQNIWLNGSINIHSQNINGNGVVLYSENGDISIGANNLSFSGLIYAPYGKVTIDCRYTNLNGVCIIANEVSVSGEYINLNANDSLLKWIIQNAVYEELIEAEADVELTYLLANGELQDEGIWIKWLTDAPEGYKVNVLESTNDSFYSVIASSVADEGYFIPFTHISERLFFKNGIGKYYSNSFYVEKVGESYIIRMIDSDEDGLSDAVEDVLGTDKFLQDTDIDGLSDFVEYFLTKTDPLIQQSTVGGELDGAADPDKDGLSSQDEITYGTNPRNADTDGDGMDDYSEVFLHQTNPLSADTDEDGLKDSSESRFDMDPLNPDSNGNGIPDGAEIYEQFILKECYEEDIWSENVAIPSIHILSKGDASDSAIVTEYIGALKNTGNEYVGKCIEVSGTAAEEGTISFSLSNQYIVPEYLYDDIKFSSLLICVSKDENTIPLETVYDENTRTLSAEYCGDGIYFVLDTVCWLESLGIDYHDVLDDLYAQSGNNTENGEDEVSKVSVSSSDARDLVDIVPEDDANVGVQIAGKSVSGQADIYFIVDTTFSMSDPIYNVKKNLDEIVDGLNEENIKANYVLIRFDDYTYDEIGVAKVLLNANGQSFFTSVEEFKTEIDKLPSQLGSGGDLPEPSLDALEYARNLRIRNNSQKFFVLVTDDVYKIDNHYGIKDLEEVITRLNGDKINTSVITNPLYFSTYTSITESTGGVLANINGDFKEQFLGLSKMIIGVTNDGTWIALNGLTPQIYKLKDVPRAGSNVDTDEDGIPDIEELMSLEPVGKFNAAKYLSLSIGSGVGFLHHEERFKEIAKWDIKVYDFFSNPALEDTDNDGLLDGRSILSEDRNIIIAPRDPAPKQADGPKGLWKEHIRSMRNGEKLATEHSENYYLYEDYDKSLRKVRFLGIDNFPAIPIFEYLLGGWASVGSMILDFQYDNREIALHSDWLQWQAIGGYNDFYDIVFDAATSMNRNKVPFSFQDEEFIIWSWKGDYLNLGPGAETGIYSNKGLVSWQYWVELEYVTKMTLSLYKKIGNGGAYTTYFNWCPDEPQWWITGFVPDNGGWNTVKEDQLVQISSVALNEELFEALYEQYSDYKHQLQYKIIIDKENRLVWVIF